MLLIIHNLPPRVEYNEIKDLLISKCGLRDVILDNLQHEGSCMKVTVGVVEDEDAAILVRKMNGIYYRGQQLYVEDKKPKKNSEQPFHASTSQHLKPIMEYNSPVEPNMPGMFAPPASYAVYPPQTMGLTVDKSFMPIGGQQPQPLLYSNLGVHNEFNQQLLAPLAQQNVQPLNLYSRRSASGARREPSAGQRDEAREERGDRQRRPAPANIVSWAAVPPSQTIYQDFNVRKNERPGQFREFDQDGSEKCGSYSGPSSNQRDMRGGHSSNQRDMRGGHSSNQGDMRGGHSSNQRDMRRDHSLNQRDMRSDYSPNQRDIRSGHSSNQWDMRGHHSSNQRDMRRGHSPNKRDMRDGHSSNQRDMRDGHSNQRDMRGGHSPNQRDMRDGHSSNQRDMRGGHSSSQRDMRGDHSVNQRDMRRGHSPNRRELRRDYSPNQRELRGGHSSNQRDMRRGRSPNQRGVRGGHFSNQRDVRRSHSPNRLDLRDGHSSNQRDIRRGHSPNRRDVRGGLSSAQHYIRGGRSTNQRDIRGGRFSNQSDIRGSHSPNQRDMRVGHSSNVRGGRSSNDDMLGHFSSSLDMRGGHTSNVRGGHTSNNRGSHTIMRGGHTNIRGGHSSNQSSLRAGHSLNQYVERDMHGGLSLNQRDMRVDDFSNQRDMTGDDSLNQRDIIDSHSLNLSVQHDIHGGYFSNQHDMRGGHFLNQPDVRGGHSLNQYDIRGGHSAIQHVMRGGHFLNQPDIRGGHSLNQYDIRGGHSSIQHVMRGGHFLNQPDIRGGHSLNQYDIRGGHSSIQHVMRGGHFLNQPDIRGGHSLNQYDIRDGQSSIQHDMRGGHSSSQPVMRGGHISSHLDMRGGHFSNELDIRGGHSSTQHNLHISHFSNERDMHGGQSSNQRDMGGDYSLNQVEMGGDHSLHPRDMDGDHTTNTHVNTNNYISSLCDGRPSNTRGDCNSSPRSTGQVAQKDKPKFAKKRRWDDQSEQLEPTLSEAQEPQPKQPAPDSEPAPLDHKQFNACKIKGVNKVMYHISINLNLKNVQNEQNTILRKILNRRVLEIMGGEMLSPDEIYERYRARYPESDDTVVFNDVVVLVAEGKELDGIPKTRKEKKWERMLLLETQEPVLNVNFQKAMIKEVELIGAILEQIFKTTETVTEKVICERVIIQEQCIKLCKKLIYSRLLRRITNTGMKIVFVFGKPSPPKQEDLESFLTPYGCLMLKKSASASFYMAFFDSYDSIDTLCSMKLVPIGKQDILITFIHMLLDRKNQNLERMRTKRLRYLHRDKLIQDSKVNLLDKNWQEVEEEERKAKAEEIKKMEQEDLLIAIDGHDEEMFVQQEEANNAVDATDLMYDASFVNLDPDVFDEFKGSNSHDVSEDNVNKVIEVIDANENKVIEVLDDNENKVIEVIDDNDTKVIEVIDDDENKYENEAKNMSDVNVEEIDLDNVNEEDLEDYCEIR